MNKGLLILIGVVVVLVIGAIILILTGGRGGQQRVAADNTVTIWSPFDDRAAFEAMSAKFFEENPGLTLEHRRIEARDAKEYEAKVVNAIANGTGPDLWMVRSDWIPKHAAKSVPLAVVGQRGSQEIIDFLVGAHGGRVISLNAFNNAIYGLPMYADTLVMVYNYNAYSLVTQVSSLENQAILRQDIETWGQFIAQSQAIQAVSGRTGINASPIGTIRSTNASVDLFSAFLLQHGGRLADERGDIVFNLPIIADGRTFLPATTALTQYTDFARPGSPNQIWSENNKDPIEEFLAGRIVMMPMYYSQLLGVLARDPNFEIKVGAFPQLSEKGARVDFGVTWSLLISATGSSDLAYDFAVSLGNGVMNYSAFRNLLAPIAEDDEINFPNRIVSLEDSRDIFKSQIPSISQLIKPEWQQVDEIFQDMIRLVIENNQLPQTSVDASTDRLRAIVR